MCRFNFLVWIAWKTWFAAKNELTYKFRRSVTFISCTNVLNNHIEDKDGDVQLKDDKIWLSSLTLPF
jgi:hypothetical protein